MTKGEFVVVVDVFGMAGLVAGLSWQPLEQLRDAIGGVAVAAIIIASLVAIWVAATAPVHGSPRELNDTWTFIGMQLASGLALAAVSLLNPALSPFALLASSAMITAFTIGTVVLLARRRR